MVRQTGRLSALAVSRAKDKAMLADGGGLYLQVSGSGSKSWILRYTLRGRAREMGLGPLHTISLAEARERARACRKLLLDGVDPIAARKAEQETAALHEARAVTFDQVCRAYLDAHEAGWSNKKHRAQWESTIQTYASPVIGHLSIQEIDTALVLKVLEPIWKAKTETASRVRGRLESVLDYAKARSQRQGENPARWRGHLDHLLPARTRVRSVAHHPALPYQELPEFMARLRAEKGTAAVALQVLILTATRTSEAIGARWAEIDLPQATWTIPGTRMKAKREHRVPLSQAALQLIQQQKALSQESDYVFQGAKPKSPLSNMALLALLRRMGRSDLTSHGFRSTFRDWAAEQTGFPREVAEMALAHTVSDKVEAAYRRGDLFEKRRHLMEAWAAYSLRLPQPALD